MSFDFSTELEIGSTIRMLTREKSAGPDGLPPILVKMSENTLMKSLFPGPLPRLIY